MVDEAVLLKKFGGHEHVVSLLEVCLQNSENCIKQSLRCSIQPLPLWLFEGSLWLVMEYAEHGSLRGYLRSQRPDSSSNKIDSGGVLATDGQMLCTDCSLSTPAALCYALQVAKGMAHLIAQKVGNSLLV